MSYQEKITNEEAEMILSHQPCNDVVTSRDDFKMLYGIASQLSSDLLAARKERDELRADRNAWQRAAKAANDRADKAEAKIREMRKALEHYADELFYFPRSIVLECQKKGIRMAPVYSDFGTTAKEALESTREYTEENGKEATNDR